MLERLHFSTRSCVYKGTQDRDGVVAFELKRIGVERESALATVNHCNLL